MGLQSQQWNSYRWQSCSECVEDNSLRDQGQHLFISECHLQRSSQTVHFSWCAYLPSRVPEYSPAILTGWYSNAATRWRALHFFMNCTNLNLELLESLEVISRTR